MRNLAGQKDWGCAKEQNMSLFMAKVENASGKYEAGWSLA
jgi:hypothetical protein